eukprot:Partr_v1_DN28774_c0_g1_i4_m63419 putative tripeptidyl peptidase ii
MIRGFDIFPKELVTRMSTERKEKFVIEHSKLVNAAQTELNAWNVAHPSSSALDEAASLAKMDLEARIEALTEAFKSYEDVGPVYDCVLFHDGKVWRAAVDTFETGDLSSFVPLADYKLEPKYCCFSSDDMLNFSVKIYDDGDVLSVVTLAGSHGTHVAAISAANYPSEPELNGIAPGARIVSLKIGDTRLGSMETGTGLTRALNSIIENGCDVCNMSYGEDAGIANSGRWIELLRDELIDKRRVIFISSAGNAGPALSTVGAPGGTTTGVIGVGAYVTSEMIKAEYALMESVPERPYTWSSQSPAYDGAQNVTIYAPGAAITSVPQYLLKNSQLMNGTSMSSPNACGNVALLISAFKSKGLSLSPYRLERALVMSAKSFNDPFKIGFLQVEAAYEYLTKHLDDSSLDINFEVTVASNNGNSRGIYLREGIDTSRVFQGNVTVTPLFRKDDKSLNPSKLAFEQRLILTSSAAHVKVPDYLLMNSGGRGFAVRVDPTALSPGLHFAQVEAYVSGDIERGPVFQLPITITKGQDLIDYKLTCKHTFTPGHIERKFINVPLGANWAEMTVKATGLRSPANFVVHLLQMVPHVRHTHTEHHWYMRLSGDDPVPSKTFKVEPLKTLELCMAQFWSSLGTYEVEVEVTFHGIYTGEQNVILDASRGSCRVELFSLLRPETITPSLSLDTLRKALKPSKSVIAPLRSRDLLINGVQNQELILTYNLSLSEPRTCKFCKPVVDNLLYDSVYDSVLFMVHNSRKRRLFFGDIYPKDMKLAKGEYTVRLQIRHDQVAMLEKIKNMPLLVDMTISSPIKPSLYGAHGDVFDSSKKPISKSFQLDINASKALFFDCFVAEYPKDAKPGDLLVGSMSYGVKVEGGTFAVSLIVPPEDSKTSDDEPKADSKDTINDAVRDAKLAFVEKLTDIEEKKKLIGELVAANPKHVSTLLKQLSFICGTLYDTDEKKGANQSEIVTVANSIIAQIDLNATLTFLAGKAEPVPTGEYKKAKTQMELSKKNWIQAQQRKAEALLCASYLKPSDDELLKSLKLVMNELKKVADVSDAVSTFLAVGYEFRLKRYGSALKIGNKFISDNDNAAVKKTAGIANYLSIASGGTGLADGLDDVQLMYQWKSIILRSLGWKCWQELETKWALVRFPKEYAPF